MLMSDVQLSQGLRGSQAKYQLARRVFVKNLDRLMKQNVRSAESRKAPAALSLDQLRRVSGGNLYYHAGPGNDVCVLQN